MPAKSKVQRRLFGIALSVKRGKTDLKDVNTKNRDEIELLSKLPEKTLIKFAGTDQQNLPYNLPNK